MKLRCLDVSKVEPGESDASKQIAAARVAGGNSGGGEFSRALTPLTGVIQQAADDTDFAEVLQLGHLADARISPRKQQKESRHAGFRG
jgi:hypothetical protein